MRFISIPFQQNAQFFLGSRKLSLVLGNLLFQKFNLVFLIIFLKLFQILLPVFEFLLRELQITLRQCVAFVNVMQTLSYLADWLFVNVIRLSRACIV